MYTALLSIIYPLLTQSVCPGLYEGTPPLSESYTPDVNTYNEAVANLDIAAVFEDLNDLMINSHECWPADTFGSGSSVGSSYGPLFIRLSWHCSGTFRAHDGKGGCGGGRQRFWPEASWPDNTNLDKARALLTPLKYKYGTALSWGDLLVFAGTAAILNMSGPVSEICAGRIDSSDGTESESLGWPNATDPETGIPLCEIQGNCQLPFGQDTLGLIYVNPEGFMGIPDRARSAQQIRTVFGRMNMSDRETVALIGGGHAFGRCHGPCTTGPGESPDSNPINPWNGTCSGNTNSLPGQGWNTFTSGFENAWTSTPLKWNNEFFRLLVEDAYELHKGPGNKSQWKNLRDPTLMMLTTDLALVNDTNYSKIAKEFADDITKLNEAFSGAWAKLVTSGGEWAANKKCIQSSELKSEEKVDESEEKKDETWFIVGIIFIILFVIACGISVFLIFVSDKVLNRGDKGKKYTQTAASGDED